MELRARQWPTRESSGRPRGQAEVGDRVEQSFDRVVASSEELLGVMTFAARQVSYHKAEAKDARQISLSVKALGPFISELPEEEQRKIRVEVAHHMFERPFSSSGHSSFLPRRDVPRTSIDAADDE